MIIKQINHFDMQPISIVSSEDETISISLVEERPYAFGKKQRYTLPLFCRSKSDFEIFKKANDHNPKIFNIITKNIKG